VDIDNKHDPGNLSVSLTDCKGVRSVSVNEICGKSRCGYDKPLRICKGANTKAD
jgi:hypothetical protein